MIGIKQPNLIEIPPLDNLPRVPIDKLKQEILTLYDELDLATPANASPDTPEQNGTTTRLAWVTNTLSSRDSAKLL